MQLILAERVRKRDAVAPLELPPRDRGVALGGIPGQGEYLDRVTRDVARYPQRLLRDDGLVEPARGRAAADSRRREVAEDRGRRVGGQAVHAERRRGRGRRAQRPGIPGNAQRRAVSGVREPAVQVRIVHVREPEPVAEHDRGEGHVGHHRKREHREGGRRPGAAPAPARRHREHVGQQRQDQHLTDLAYRSGHAKQGSAAGQPGQARGRPPQQQRHRGDDQRLEQHIGHDHLLGLHLVSVEQHRRRGEGGQPAPRAVPAAPARKGTRPSRDRAGAGPPPRRPARRRPAGPGAAAGRCTRAGPVRACRSPDTVRCRCRPGPAGRRSGRRPAARARRRGGSRTASAVDTAWSRGHRIVGGPA